MQDFTSATLNIGRVTLHGGQGHDWSVASLWLRDNCRCPACRHPGNGQKLYGVADLPMDLAVRAASLAADHSLHIVWSDGHQSRYAASWLASHDLSAPARRARALGVKLWSRKIAADMPTADWPSLQADTAVELAWLERYAELGFGVLRKVPRESGMVAQVGDRLGFVRVTNYGRLFDVMSVPNPTNLAYTAVGLGVHSDNPYRHPSPGVQLLHCLESEAPGGDTLLVDGFSAAEMLRSEDPAAFALLSSVPMTFRYSDANTDLVARQTLICTDMDGAVRAVHFNNRSADWLDAPAEVAEDWYGAYVKFAHILQRPELELVFRLAPGECLVMQNDRTLHGRTAFDPNLGRRHLQGCYIDGDALESRRQVLCRALARLPLEQIHAAFARRGHESYGEGVSLADHSIQCAAFAQRDKAAPGLVAAALLHDVGHMLHELPENVADSGLDTQHESLGSVWLSQYFGPEVTEPVRMHVAAKRYLATTEPGYFDKLSDASKLSLKLQGGPMSTEQARAFEAERFFADAVRLRRWDEEGKIVGYQGPDAASFDGVVLSCLKPA